MSGSLEDMKQGIRQTYRATGVRPNHIVMGDREAAEQIIHRSIAERCPGTYFGYPIQPQPWFVLGRWYLRWGEVLDVKVLSP